MQKEWESSKRRKSMANECFAESLVSPTTQMSPPIPTNLQINLCLRNVSNLLDLEYFCFKMLCVHSKCMDMMHHKLAQKKRDLVFFWWDRQYFCLIIEQKAGWLVGMLSRFQGKRLGRADTVVCSPKVPCIRLIRTNNYFSSWRAK